MDNKLFDDLLIKADFAIKNKLVMDMDLLEVVDLLYSMELEKIEKDKLSDSLIDYNDEIVSIESVGEKETIDITVTGDNLFYCNNILTKNSAGLPMTVDFLLAGIRTEELDEMNQIMFKQLKSRYNDVNYYKRFVIGIDIKKFKFYNIEEPTSGLQDKGRTDDTLLHKPGNPQNKKNFTDFEF